MGWVVERRAKDGSWRYQARYRDPDGAKRTVGTYTTRKEADTAILRAETAITDGTWIDPDGAKIGFTTYAQTMWLPSRHLEVSTRAGYASYLRKHFVPFFAETPIGKIGPAKVQAWVTHAVDQGLSPRSITKYHVMLHAVFARAVRDRLIAFNPCEDTELPKVITRRARILTPAEFDQLIAAIPDRFHVMVLVAIETGLRWGELIALRPRHLDPADHTITVTETIVEVSKKDSPTGQRMIVKPYPKDDEPRTLAISPDLVEAIQTRIAQLQLRPGDLLFPSTETPGGQPLSRATFNTRYWRPAVTAAGIDYPLRIHDLRHAHASWLLAGGADLATVMARMGHANITTTQQYLHTLPDADRKALDAFEAVRQRR